MNAQEIFRRVTLALEAAGIPYMLTGSFAGTFHGVLRATQDIDIVISPAGDQLRALVNLLPKNEYYLDAQGSPHFRNILITVAYLILISRST